MSGSENNNGKSVATYPNPTPEETESEKAMREKLGLRGGRVMGENPEIKVEYKHNTSLQQFVKYSFYKLDPAFRRLPRHDREQGIKEFLAVMEDLYPRGELLRPYSLSGVRGDCDFMLWHVVPCNKDGDSPSGLERFQEVNSTILSTGLGAYLTLPYHYWAMTKR